MRFFANVCLVLFLVNTLPAQVPQTLYIGTSSNDTGRNRGIYVTQFDPVSGGFTAATLAAEARNPGFVVENPRNALVYAAGETGDPAVKPAPGAVDAYQRNPDGTLTRVSNEPTGGGPVTHLVVDGSGQMVVTVSYHGGQVISLPIGPDGKVSAPVSVCTQERPLGPRADRQDKSHPHSVTLTPDDRFVYVSNLGEDRVFCYQINPAKASLTPAGDFPVAPGTGPRHSKCSSDGLYLYVIGELGNTVTVFYRDAATGALENRQVIGTLPADFHGESICSEIQIHRSGRFVYAANRGHDSIAVFARNPLDGTLKLVEIMSCGGKHPRHFALSPDGAWLVCAGRDTDNLVSFRIDPATGRLTKTGELTGVPSPTCVYFVPVK